MNNNKWLDEVKKEESLEKKIIREKIFYEEITACKFIIFFPWLSVVMFPSLFTFIALLIYSLFFMFIINKKQKKSKDLIMAKGNVYNLLSLSFISWDAMFMLKKDEIVKENEEKKSILYRELTRIDIEEALYFCKLNPCQENLDNFRVLKYNHLRYSLEIKNEKIKEQIEREECLLEKQQETIITD